eukprot:1141287-Pelagomonas_calceolata.AAC.7
MKQFTKFNLLSLLPQVDNGDCHTPLNCLVHAAHQFILSTPPAHAPVAGTLAAAAPGVCSRLWQRPTGSVPAGAWAAGPGMSAGV